MKEAKTLEEFEELSKLGEWFYVTSGSWVARGQSHVEARGQSHVVAWGQSHVEAWEQSHVEAWGQSHVVAWGQSHVEAWGQSHVEAWEQSSCSKYSEFADAHGNVLDFTKYPKTVEEWLEKYKVQIVDDYCLLYKGTNKEYQTQRGTSWRVGEDTTALDWEDREDIECGYGLHFCHHPICCEQFTDVKHYLACQIKVSDIRIYKDQPQHPDKIRAKSCKVLYEVDRWGEKINPPKRDSKGRFSK